MNYYIKGNKEKAELIKAAFESKGYDTTGWKFNVEGGFYYTAERKRIDLACGNFLINLIKTHPDYQELELPVEPKFKVRGWVVYNGASVWQVNEIDRNMPIPRYELTNNDGDKLSVPFTSEYNLKEWTIQDAKDGDVLVNGGFIFIFKNIDDGNGVHYYCAYEIRSQKEYEQFHIACFNSLMGRVGNSYTHYTPATKEQSALLFQKMEEAGYEWDADKKELRKIKPHYDIANFKPFDKVLVRFCDGANWCCALFSHYCTRGNCHFVCSGGSVTQCIPFEGNEHLLGTTDMCDEYYINW